MDIVIWLSIGVFLLLPYYLRIFLLDKSKTIYHIIFWIGINALMSLLYYVIYGQVCSAALMGLAVYVLYYFFSYEFYVKNLEKTLIYEEIKSITQTKKFTKTINIALILTSFILFFDILIILNYINESTIIDRIYLIGIIVLSFIQIIVYSNEYKNIK